jgi:thioredoxin 1
MGCMTEEQGGTQSMPPPRKEKEYDMASQVTDGNFESEVLKNDVPVLVDFWAPWCGPCRAMGPVVDELAEEYAGKIKVVKMNVDENSGTPSKYGIRAIPTLILFKGGEVVEQVTGAVSKSSIKEMISSKI